MYEEVLEFMKSQARQAGKVMMDRLHDDYQVYIKPDNSRVTDIDLAVSEQIQEAVATQFPDAGLYSEESDDKTILPGKPYFIVDELDGTSSYIDDKTGFSHHAAYFEPDKGIQIGLIYYPWNDALLYTTRGKGVFLEQNGGIRQLTPISPKPFDQLVYYHSSGYRGKKYTVLFRKMGVDKHRIIRTDTRRSLLMALGQLDVSLTLRPHVAIWDLASEKAIIEELGFSHCYLDGSPVRFGEAPPSENRGYLKCPANWKDEFLEKLPGLLPKEHKS